MFPINVSLFAHLGKIVAETKFASLEAKMFPRKFRNNFVAKTVFPSFSTCFQMFSTRETLFFRLGMLKVLTDSCEVMFLKQYFPVCQRWET